MRTDHIFMPKLDGLHDLVGSEVAWFCIVGHTAKVPEEAHSGHQRSQPLIQIK